MSKQSTILQFFKATTQINENKNIEEKKPRQQKKKKVEVKKGMGLDRFFRITTDMSPAAIERRERIKQQMAEQLKKLNAAKEEQIRKMKENREIKKKKRKENERSLEEEEENERRYRNITYNENDFGIEICKNVYLGSAAAGANIEWLEEVGINYIVNCTPDVMCFYNSKENPDFNLNDFPGITEKEYLRIAINDADDEDISKFFNQSFEFIEKAIELKQKVLVHCLLGRSRSATIVTAFIMKKYKIKLNDVLELFELRHYETNINDGFTSQLLQLQSKLFNEPINMRRTRRITSQSSEHLDIVNNIINELN
ncbi:hypothetical protein ENUP19_0053G0012 [Entamoeba nuttalli]|uniref:protein-tyrosine-phosphatase n=2 Tax=Entamoeba nuttalli TaxID=412467 RepID=K2H859_ENTNP|nr:dual specificity protein phosphatase, putative [Entamoeba nuttalli P19]EKE38684.1 dual specificity protein phosphatase, putative [Entamoeba nuttalli P19]|eukprot:XP_008858980.1 dual specificity protein phosphatase, putative [Entamoeba nuttalli P19]